MNWQQAALAVLVGAVIGYITNWVAIRMLFRPRNEIRILGVHLPFTPGVIPGGKKRLAESIGRVVGGMLLTEENVLHHLLQPGVEDQVRQRVNTRLAELASRGVTVGELLGSGGGGTGAEPAPGGPVREELVKLLAGTAGGLLQNKDLRRSLARWMAGVVYDTLDRPVGPAAGSSEFAALRTSLENLPGKIPAFGEANRELRNRLAQKIENLFNSPEPVGSYLPGAVRDGLHEFIAGQTPRLAAALEQYLSSPGVRKAIKNRIEDFFEGTALKKLLNGVFLLAGSGPDAIVRRLVQELSSFFADEQNRAELEERLHILVDEALAKSVAETTSALDAAARREKAGEIADWLLDKLQRPGTLAPLWDAVEDMLAANSHRTWRELFHLDELGLPGMLEDYLDGLLERLVERDRGVRRLERLAGRAVDGLLNAPLGRVMEMLPPQLAADPGEPVVQLYRYAVKRHMPGLLSFFDVTGMVRQRVEELDVLQVEEMLLGIVRRELVAITWLGALLGALLGTVMVGMQYL